jgi:predicted MFS family arabinose efflux permease
LFVSKMTDHLNLRNRELAMNTHTTVHRPMRLLLCMALGTFAVGTEGFMIAPLLPQLAADLSQSIVVVGQLVTVFTLSYAFSSPILTTLTGDVSRRNLLIAAMAGFAMANVVAACAPNYWTLMFARVLLALIAGLYVPNANALAGAIVPPEQRGRALAIVTGGTSVAVALGVPLSALVGQGFGWRVTFAIVGALALFATAGLALSLARDVGANLPVARLSERIAVFWQKPLLLALVVTLLWATGAYAVYTYLSLFLARVVGISGFGVGLVLFVWGISAAIGVTIGGTLTDRLGSKRVIVTSLSLLALAFVTMSASAYRFSPAAARVPVLTAIVVWGLAAWSFFPAQQSRLLGLAGVKLGSVVLSLNASFMFGGFALGAAIGSATVAYGSPEALGFVGAVCVSVSLLIALLTTRDKKLVPSALNLVVASRDDEEDRAPATEMRFLGAD